MPLSEGSGELSRLAGVGVAEESGSDRAGIPDGLPDLAKPATDCRHVVIPGG